MSNLHDKRDQQKFYKTEMSRLHSNLTHKQYKQTDYLQHEGY